jgi:hypothetical protein
MLKVVGEIVVATPMNVWANTNPFPFFWVASKTGVTMAGTCQSRKAWIAKLLELLILNGNGGSVKIPKKLDSICAFLPPYSEVRLADFVVETASTTTTAEKVKAESKKTESKKAESKKAESKDNLVLELVDDPTTITI